MKRAKGWPKPIANEALHGPLGLLVKLVDPHTESSSEGRLVASLVTFGNLIGRNVSYQIEATSHFCNENALFIGKSSFARKGTMQDIVDATIAPIDPTFEKRRAKGITSGEGVAWCIRDERTEGAGEFPKISDVGVDDKRLLVIEPEFASVLKVMRRDGNTVSTVIREGWHSKPLQNLSKNTPFSVTAPHISIIGHITEFEMRRALGEVELFNGFMNRFLPVCVDRPKLLAFGGRFPQNEVSPVVDQLKKAFEFAKQRRKIVLSDEAKADWPSLYQALNRELPGLLGAVTARGPAHILRIAMIYAIADCSAVIRREHLKAATAVWDYCFNSAKYIFGESTGNQIADRILEELRTCKIGLTQTDFIEKVFKRNRTATDISSACDELLNLGLIRSESHTSGGRPATRWFAQQPGSEGYELNEENDVSNQKEDLSSLTRLTRTPAGGVQ